MLKGRASNYYYQHLRGCDYKFVQMVNMTRSHFETEEFSQEYLTKWRETTLNRVIREYREKSKLECLQIVIDELQGIQQGLSPEYQRENNLRDQLLNARRGIKECNTALFNPARSFEGLCSQLRSSIGFTKWKNKEIIEQTENFIEKLEATIIREEDVVDTIIWDDRVNLNSKSETILRRCYICNRKGCWSTKHPKKDQYNANKEFEHNLTTTYYRSTSREEFQHLLIDSEGVEETEDVVKASEALADFNIDEEYDIYLAEMGEIDGIETVTILNDRSAFHAITKEDIFIN
ncbi:hypothetical protein K3495_g8071 [Podosphaera aphanis]|nr:hypothetical protein K3495_g8071 [Podosphaera aphanis]